MGNFDWQSRNFFAPKGTPTVVPTAFAARAFVEAAREFHDGEYLSVARSACDFIINDLPRCQTSSDQVCFSYAPQSDTQIFNASLMAAEVLASVGGLTGEVDLLALAEMAARYVIRQQRTDGSWTYGADRKQGWIDNFHTAFILFSLKRVMMHVVWVLNSSSRCNVVTSTGKRTSFLRTVGRNTTMTTPILQTRMPARALSLPFWSCASLIRTQ